jgi:hypothetical protein
MGLLFGVIVGFMACSLSVPSTTPRRVFRRVDVESAPFLVRQPLLEQELDPAR